MEISFEIKKRHVYGVLIFVFLFSIILVVSAYTYNNLDPNFWGHTGDQVSVYSTDGVEKDFQTAIDNGDFTNSRSLSDFKPSKVHQPKIFSINGDIDLQSASAFNSNKIKTCLLTQFKEINLGPMATCDISYDSVNSKWMLKVNNAECGVICLEWEPLPYNEVIYR